MFFPQQVGSLGSPPQTSLAGLFFAEITRSAEGAEVNPLAPDVCFFTRMRMGVQYAEDTPIWDEQRV